MKRLTIATALCALALTACGADGVNSTPTPASAPIADIATKADTVILSGERAFGVAELAYTTAAHGVEMLVDTGAIKGPTATKFRTLNATARGLLVNGKSAANAADKARAAAELLGIVSQINALKGGK